MSERKEVKDAAGARWWWWVVWVGVGLGGEGVKVEVG